MSILEKNNLSFSDVISLIKNPDKISLSDATKSKIIQSYNRVQKLSKNNEAVYGINTGFGPLCTKRISVEEAELLQKNLLLSHAVGVGEPVDPIISKIMLVCKIISLSKGYSGVRLEIIERLIFFIQNDIIPVVPKQGSVGASGDLAPLSHLFLPLIGMGYLWNEKQKVSCEFILKKHKLNPFKLKAKEGLALINGTQFILAHAIQGISKLEYLFDLADLAAGMTVEGFQGSITPFMEELHDLRPFDGTKKVAKRMRSILKNSENTKSHINCDRVQDPYSIRCIPQVHGASRNALNHLKELTQVEINSVTDNPIILDNGVAVSGGNFHGQPLALAIDYLSIAVSEIGNISDRRIYLLLEGLYGLPKMLSENPGINSGFMVTQYTTAALVSENKSMCFPVSSDSIPTGMGQEDHVSMGSISGTKLLQVINNIEKIIAIELLNASQALEFRRPNKFSPIIELSLDFIRKHVKKLKSDRLLSYDIEKMIELVNKRLINVKLDL
ncbi:MAG: histidine ammonia-lyase [Flavobacteriaceae bacterium]|nr:histidine ammonia-lyase [Flavobacteriaceae bacterium]|tara:strand:+ start:36979 stop:38478 length:1500 start_codon:yes stop_codon:yes gene_type:complete